MQLHDMTFTHCIPCFTKLTARLVSEAFYMELKVRLLVAEGKLTLDECTFQQDADKENIMEKIEFIRSRSIYPHNNCTAECKERGVYATVVTMDRNRRSRVNWKQ